MRSRVLALLTAFMLLPGIRAQPPVQPRTDFLGDPLPEGAIARIGTLRFKHNPAHGSTVDITLFTPDGGKIVSLSQDYESVRLWDAASGAELAVLRGHEDRVLSAVFDPSEARVLTASGDNTARLGRERRPTPRTARS